MSRVESVPRQNTVPEARGYRFDLGFDAVGHVFGGTVWDVTVRPPCVVAVRNPARVEKGGLCEDHKGLVRSIGLSSVSVRRLKVKDPLIW